MRRGLVSIGILAIQGVLLAACDKTPEECRTLGEVLKANEAALQEGKSAEYKAEPGAAATLARSYASAVDAEIKRLSALELTNTRLARYSEDLRATLTEAKGRAQSLASAYDAMVPPTDAACLAETAWTESRAPINELCKSDDPTCAQIDLLAQPGTGDRSLADELESYATKLEGIQVEDARLQQAVLKRVNLARDYAAAQRASSIQAAKVDAASGPYFRAIAKGRPALRDIARECKR
jgi:hypothetical protein